METNRFNENIVGKSTIVEEIELTEEEKNLGKKMLEDFKKEINDKLERPEEK